MYMYALSVRYSIGCMLHIPANYQTLYSSAFLLIVEISLRKYVEKILTLKLDLFAKFGKHGNKIQMLRLM